MHHTRHFQDSKASHNRSLHHFKYGLIQDGICHQYLLLLPSHNPNNGRTRLPQRKYLYKYSDHYPPLTLRRLGPMYSMGSHRITKGHDPLFPNMLCLHRL